MSVTPAPTSCSGVSVSPRKTYPVATANPGVKKVRLDSRVRFPADAL